MAFTRITTLVSLAPGQKYTILLLYLSMFSWLTCSASTRKTTPPPVYCPEGFIEVEGYPTFYNCTTYEELEKLDIKPPIVLVGNGMNMTCRLSCDVPSFIRDLTNAGYLCNSSYTIIKKPGTGGYVLNTTILNDRTIWYEKSDVDLKDGGSYHCYQRHPTLSKKKFVAHKYVYVGVMERAEYLNCTTPNWAKAVCTWCDEDKTKFDDWNVTYLTGNKGNWRACPKRTRCSCTWDNEGTTVHNFYRMVTNIRITASNKYGTSNETFMIDFYNHSYIVPNPVVSVIVTPAGSGALSVTFEGPKNLAGVIHLFYDISLQSKFDVKPMIQTVENKKRKEQSVIFKGLIPWVNYTAKVRVRPGNGTYWSLFKNGTAVTLPSVPGRNPETRISSFHSHLCGEKECRNVIIYFKEIPEKFTHGNIISMQASVNDDRIKTTKCPEFKLRKCEIKVPLTSAFTITLTASTSVGAGPLNATSRMSIPKYDRGAATTKNLVGEIQNATDTEAVVLFEWSYGSEEKPNNFVLYGIIENKVNWWMLNGTVTTAEIVIKHSQPQLQKYQFAVAPEKSGTSTGMSKPFLKCLYEFNGENPVIQPLKFDAKKQGQKSLTFDIKPQDCERGHRQIISIIINLIQVNAKGETDTGYNKTVRIKAPNSVYKHVFEDLEDSTYYNISLTAVCRNEPRCQHSPGVKLKTNPPLPFVFPPWAIGVIVFVILAVLFVVGFGIYRFYKRVTSEKGKVAIKRIPAVTRTPYLDENGVNDELYEITLDSTALSGNVHERSESESSSTDGESSANREQHRLIPNGKSKIYAPRRLMSHESAGSGHSAMTDMTYLPSESDSDEMYLGGSPRSINMMSHTDLQPVPEAAEDGKKSTSPSEHEYDDIVNEDPSGDVFIDTTAGNSLGRYVANPRSGPRVFSRPQTAPAHILPRPEPRPSWETRQNPKLAQDLQPKSANPDSCDFRKKAAPVSDVEGASGGDYDDEYCKLTMKSPGLQPEAGKVDTEGYLVPNIAGDLDEEGYYKPKSSSGESGDEQTKKLPQVLILQDHEFVDSSSSSDDSDDEDSYAKVSHETVLGPGGYVQRNEPIARSTPPRTFTPIEQGPGGYCTISPNATPQRSQENLAGSPDLPILNLQPMDMNGIGPLPPFTLAGSSSVAAPAGSGSVAAPPPVYVLPPDSPPWPVSNSNVLQEPAINSPPFTVNGYIQHPPDPVVMGQDPLNFTSRPNDCLGIPGEYDSEDDSSATLSDSGVGSIGAFPRALQGMPVNGGGYVQRLDQFAVEDTSKPDHVKNKDTSSVANHSEPNDASEHSITNCARRPPNQRLQNGYVTNFSEPPPLIPVPNSLNSNNSNSNNSDSVQSVPSVGTDANRDNSANSYECATLPVTLDAVEHQPQSGKTEEGSKNASETSREQGPSAISSNPGLSNGYVDSSVLVGTSETPIGDRKTNPPDDDSCESGDEDEPKLVNSGYVSKNVMHVC